MPQINHTNVYVKTTLYQDKQAKPNSAVLDIGEVCTCTSHEYTPLTTPVTCNKEQTVSGVRQVAQSLQFPKSGTNV
jgi:hypothetical protein